MNMKITYKANYAGYLVVLRAIQMLLKDGTLNFTQLGAFICFVAEADFDSRHPYYTVITRDDAELANAWGCNSSTVTRKRKELIRKGLLSSEDGLTKVTNFSLFELQWVKTYAKLKPTILQVLFAKTLSESAKEMEKIAIMQANQPQNDAQSFNISSKGELTSFDGDKEYIDSILDNEIDEENNTD